VILLDTHALVWAVADPKRLSRAAAAAIREAQQEGGLAVSAITLWELAPLVARGRIQTYGTLDASV
jgi:PIN domain nuclease of toxin-antitoxin system